MIDPFRKREIYVDSKLERRIYTCMVVDPETKELNEQVYVSCKDGNKLLQHHIDCVRTLTNGVREALFVKPSKLVKSSGLEHTVRTIAANLGRAVADKYFILTEDDVDWRAFQNAEEIIRYGLMFDYDARDRVLTLLRTHTGRITPRQASALTDLGTRGSDALIALLQSGAVRLVNSSTLIDLDTPFDNFVGRLTDG